MANKIAIIVVSADEQRLWSALSYAAANAALGKSVSLFFSGDAAACCRAEYRASAEALHVAKGVATIAELFSSCQGLGADFSVCQTGMQLCDVTAADLNPEVLPSGFLAWLVGKPEMPVVF
jgi:predicted peroxiredoxin